jgi:hypothetical protein
MFLSDRELSPAREHWTKWDLAQSLTFLLERDQGLGVKCAKSSDCTIVESFGHPIRHICRSDNEFVFVHLDSICFTARLSRPVRFSEHRPGYIGSVDAVGSICKCCLHRGNFVGPDLWQLHCLSRQLRRLAHVCRV